MLSASSLQNTGSVAVLRHPPRPPAGAFVLHVYSLTARLLLASPGIDMRVIGKDIGSARDPAATLRGLFGLVTDLALCLSPSWAAGSVGRAPRAASVTARAAKTAASAMLPRKPFMTPLPPSVVPHQVLYSLDRPLPSGPPCSLLGSYRQGGGDGATSAGLLLSPLRPIVDGGAEMRTERQRRAVACCEAGHAVMRLELSGDEVRATCHRAVAEVGGRRRLSAASASCQGMRSARPPGCFRAERQAGQAVSGYSCAAPSLHATRSARPPQRPEASPVTLQGDNSAWQTVERP